MRGKVIGFTPDGAADEQLAWRIAADAFPNLRVVLRCSQHAVPGAIKAGWAGDDLSQEITRTLVQEVSKYIRSSDRFALRVGAKAAEEAVAEVINFSFAPQRFGSRDKPLARFILLAKPVLEAPALEVSVPTSAECKARARDILRWLDTAAWCMVGMLADLADDCSRFVRRLDRKRVDPVEFVEALEDFRRHSGAEYARGRMQARKGTYAERIMGLLRGTRIVSLGREHTVLRRPTQRESSLCHAHVANAAAGILGQLKAEFPRFAAQARFACFRTLAGDPPPDAQPALLRELLLILGWDRQGTERCIEQYTAAWPWPSSGKRG